MLGHFNRFQASVFLCWQQECRLGVDDMDMPLALLRDYVFFCSSCNSDGDKEERDWLLPVAFSSYIN